MTYLLIKQVHIISVAISIIFFCIRLYWSVLNRPYLQQRWVKILPHIVDTVLLTCAIYLMFYIQAWPTQQPWIAAKIVALLVYIGLGTFAIKRGKTPFSRLAFGTAAVLVFIYMIGTALSHNPMSWLA